MGKNRVTRWWFSSTFSSSKPLLHTDSQESIPLAPIAPPSGYSSLNGSYQKQSELLLLDIHRKRMRKREGKEKTTFAIVLPGCLEGHLWWLGERLSLGRELCTGRWELGHHPVPDSFFAALWVACSVPKKTALQECCNNVAAAAAAVGDDDGTVRWPSRMHPPLVRCLSTCWNHSTPGLITNKITLHNWRSPHHCCKFFCFQDYSTGGGFKLSTGLEICRWWERCWRKTKPWPASQLYWRTTTTESNSQFYPLPSNGV